MKKTKNTHILFYSKKITPLIFKKVRTVCRLWGHPTHIEIPPHIETRGSVFLLAQFWRAHVTSTLKKTFLNTLRIHSIFSKKIGKNTFSSHFRHITSSENWKSGFETPHCDNTAAGRPSRTPSDFANFFPTHNGSHNVQRRTTRFCPKIGKNENGKNAVFPKKNQHITSSLMTSYQLTSFQHGKRESSTN